MAAFQKFQDFSEQLHRGVHQLHAAGHTLKVYLSNGTPSASADAVKADLAEISAGNGYTAGGVDVQNDSTETGGTTTVTGVSLQITASGGSIGPFQYAVLYNDTAASDNLIGWWDYGSPITLATGENIAIKFNDAAVGVAGTIFTHS